MQYNSLKQRCLSSCPCGHVCYAVNGWLVSGLAIVCYFIASISDFACLILVCILALRKWLTSWNWMCEEINCGKIKRWLSWMLQCCIATMWGILAIVYWHVLYILPTPYIALFYIHTHTHHAWHYIICLPACDLCNVNTCTHNIPHPTPQVTQPGWLPLAGAIVNKTACTRVMLSSTLPL